ncbi:hypothetical protein CY34DRAFT_19587 [Suillus luteus UH-Slu-Lm8-n1]|uniref:Uncharacterized protein n=1 Tax=Suillus luteus UH-Slu-Lm8-n1 TaxID=930992 RepID=A0A0C9ZR14_9AGAM|nr:hypothetical protein CY34DRAFT_19587 [Suillus luteus UH-Slu-Lm8-n1]
MIPSSPPPTTALPSNHTSSNDMASTSTFLPRLFHFRSSFGDAVIRAVRYWYAYTVWEALKRLFPGYQKTMLNEGRSRFCGQDVGKAESVEAVCELHRAEWARFESAAE